MRCFELYFDNESLTLHSTACN